MGLCMRWDGGAARAETTQELVSTSRASDPPQRTQPSEEPRTICSVGPSVSTIEMGSCGVNTFSTMVTNSPKSTIVETTVHCTCGSTSTLISMAACSRAREQAAIEINVEVDPHVQCTVVSTIVLFGEFVTIVENVFTPQLPISIVETEGPTEQMVRGSSEGCVR